MVILCSDNYSEILEKIKLLSNAAKRKLIIDISLLININSYKYSTLRTAKELNISVSTAFIWRHKILDAIRAHYKCSNLSSKVQCDETFFQESFKGNHSKDGFVMPRKTHKRGGEAKLRGISKEKYLPLMNLKIFILH